MQEEQLVQVNTNAKIENLKTFGFKEAGAHGGNSSSLKVFLTQIYGGNLIDEKVLLKRTPEQKEGINNEISLMENNISVRINKIESIKNSDIAKFEKKVNEYEGKLEKYIEGGITDKNMGGTIEIFNRNKFIVSSFFLIMLSIFIFFFYVAVVYKALFINPQDILNDIQNGNWGISLLPHWYEIVEALTTNLMVIFAPLIFFGFGYAIHVLIEIESRIKYFYIILVVAVTFALDYLLADQIHIRVNQALEIIDSPPGDFKDIIIVLIMGFVVYIIWSIIFHHWMDELNKLNIPNRLRKLIESNRKEIEKCNKEIHLLQEEIKSSDLKIIDLQKLLNETLIPISVIINSLTEFSQGWIRFVHGTDNPQLLNECEVVYSTFMKSKGLENFKYENGAI